MKQIAAKLIDWAPAWLWKPANMRFVGEHYLHFCFGDGGRRTVEWDGRELGIGHRQWLSSPSPDQTGSPH